MYYNDLDTPLFQVRSSCVFGLLGHSHQQVPLGGDSVTKYYTTLNFFCFFSISLNDLKVLNIINWPVFNNVRLNN